MCVCVFVFALYVRRVCVCVFPQTARCYGVLTIMISVDHCFAIPESVARGPRLVCPRGPVVPWSRLASLSLALSFCCLGSTLRYHFSRPRASPGELHRVCLCDVLHEGLAVCAALCTRGRSLGRPRTKDLRGIYSKGEGVAPCAYATCFR